MTRIVIVGSKNSFFFFGFFGGGLSSQTPYIYISDFIIRDMALAILSLDSALGQTLYPAFQVIYLPTTMLKADFSELSNREAEQLTMSSLYSCVPSTEYSLSLR